MTPALAEYRAFLHQVTVNQPLGEPIRYLVASNLDSKQYKLFYGRRSLMQVMALQSWMCFGHTGYKHSICPDPNGKTYPRGPFSLAED